MKNIRLIITLLCAACVSIPALAQKQQRPDPVFYDTSKSQNFIEIGAHASVGLSSLLQNYSKQVAGLSDFQLSAGCMLGTGIDVRFNFRNSFGIGTGLEMGINNFRYAMSIVNSSSNSIASIYVNNHFYNYSVPLYVSFRFNIGRRMIWNADGGVYFSQGIDGSMRISGYTSGDNALGQPVVSHTFYKTEYFDEDRPYINGVKKFDWGPRLATGLIYKHRYFLKTVLQMSASNLAVNKGVLDVKYRNLNLAFQMGYVF